MLLTLMESRSVRSACMMWIFLFGAASATTRRSLAPGLSLTSAKTRASGLSESCFTKPSYHLRYWVGMNPLEVRWLTHTDATGRSCNNVRSHTGACFCCFSSGRRLHVTTQSVLYGVNSCKWFIPTQVKVPGGERTCISQTIRRSERSESEQLC